MAGSSIIGALRVVLGADTAQFEKGLKGAKGGLQGFAADAAKLGAAIAASMAAAATALAYSIKTTIDEADKMGKTAQSIGIPVEALSQLKYAAEASRVSFESLTGAMTGFSKNIADAAADAESDAGRAFAAIGVSAADAAGKIRPTIDVLNDVANKFATYKDNAAKTALANKVFGDSGAALIPMMKNGAAGLRSMMTEADQLGLTLSQNTTDAADRFNATLARIHAIFTGVQQGGLTKAMQVFLPYLQDMAYWLQQATREGGAMNAAIGAIDVSLKLASSSIQIVKAGFFGIANAIGMVAGAMAHLVTGDFTGALDALKTGVAEITKIGTEAATNIRSTWNGWAASIEQVGTTVARNEAPVVQSVKKVEDAAAAAARELANMHRAAMDAMHAILSSPTETMAAKMAAVEQAVRNGTITFARFGETVRRIQKDNVSNLQDLASATATALTTIFPKSKAAAIAAAIINTAQGITKNLATYPQPIAGIMAALTAASGAAQIAAIKSTNMGGGGSAPSASAGGGASDPGAAMPSQMLTVQGINPNDMFNGDGVRSLVQKLLAFQKDGGQVVLA